MRFDVYYPRGLIGDGGVTRSMWQWMLALSELGHSFRLLTDPLATRPVDPPRGVDVVPIAHAGKGRWRVPREMGKHLKGSFLILHSGYVPSNAIAGKEARRNAIPYIAVPHGAYHGGVSQHHKNLKRIWKPIERGFLERAFGVHIFFEAEAIDVRRIAPRASFIIAPTGVEPTNHEWKGGGGYLAWFGRFDMHVKGIDLLVRAWGSLPKENRPALVIRGKNSRNSLREIKDLVNESNLERWISVGGPVSEDERDSLLQTSEGCVFPSRGESHSMALTEAMRMGVPCVVTSTMPISKQLEPHRGAIVVGPSPTEIANGVTDLMALGVEIGARGKSFVERNLSWERISKDFVNQIFDLNSRAVMPNAK